MVDTERERTIRRLTLLEIENAQMKDQIIQLQAENHQMKEALRDCAPIVDLLKSMALWRPATRAAFLTTLKAMAELVDAELEDL